MFCAQTLSLHPLSHVRRCLFTVLSSTPADQTIATGSRSECGTRWQKRWAFPGEPRKPCIGSSASKTWRSGRTRPSSSSTRHPHRRARRRPSPRAPHYHPPPTSSRSTRTLPGSRGEAASRANADRRPVGRSYSITARRRLLTLRDRRPRLVRSSLVRACRIPARDRPVTLPVSPSRRPGDRLRWGCGIRDRNGRRRAEGRVSERVRVEG